MDIQREEPTPLRLIQIIAFEGPAYFFASPVLPRPHIQFRNMEDLRKLYEQVESLRREIEILVDSMAGSRELAAKILPTRMAPGNYASCDSVDGEGAPRDNSDRRPYDFYE